jgi:hypothetical protein
VAERVGRSSSSQPQCLLVLVLVPVLLLLVVVVVVLLLETFQLEQQRNLPAAPCAIVRWSPAATGATPVRSWPAGASRMPQPRRLGHVCGGA